MTRQNNPPVMNGRLLRAAGPWICAALLVFVVSVPVAGIAAAAPSADGAFSIHISSFQQEINAIKHVRQLAAKGWPTYYRKVILPRKGTWWRVYVGPYTTEAEAGKQAGRLKGQGVSPYAAVERTGPEAAERPSSPPPPVEQRAAPARERVTPAAVPATPPAKGRIFFPDMTSTEPIGPSTAVKAARQPPAAGPAEPARPSKPAAPPPAVLCQGDACGPKPASAAAFRWAEPPLSTSRATPPPVPSASKTPAATASRPARRDPIKTGGIHWGDLKEDPGWDEEPPATAPPAPAVDSPRGKSAAEPAAVREVPATAPMAPGDRVEARKYYEKANEYVAKGMLEIAVANYSRSIELDPSFAEAYNGRGLTYEAIQRSELAISDYDAALRLKPDYVDAIYNRALACRKSGRFAQANRDLESACALKHRGACELLAQMKGTRK